MYWAGDAGPNNIPRYQIESPTLASDLRWTKYPISQSRRLTLPLTIIIIYFIIFFFIVVFKRYLFGFVNGFFLVCWFLSVGNGLVIPTWIFLVQMVRKKWIWTMSD